MSGGSFGRIDKNFDCDILDSNHNPFNPIKRGPADIFEQCHILRPDWSIEYYCKGKGEQTNFTHYWEKYQLVCCPSPCALGTNTSDCELWKRTA